MPLTVLIDIDREGNWLTNDLNELQMNTDVEDAISQVKWPTRTFGEFPSTEYPEKR